MKKPILFFLIFSFLQSGLAQDAIGLLRVEVTPGTAWVKVDSVLVKPSPDNFQPYQFKLPPGMHRIEIWAQGFTPWVDSVLIEANKAKDYQFGFKYKALDPEFVSYRKEYKQYWITKFSRGATITAGVVGTVGLMIYTFNNPNLNYYKEQAIGANERYRNNVAAQDFQVNKAAFENFSALYEDAQKKRNVKYMVGIPVALTAGGITYWLYTKYKKKPLVKPTYPDKNPFVFKPIFEPSPAGLCLGVNLTF
ncbi:MAG: hypothetical protein ACKV1O_17070 [Saprospiraceae bacterium]